MAIRKVFTVPDDQAFGAIGRELDLDNTQINELRIAVQHAHADLEGYFRTRTSRTDWKRRVDKLKAIQCGLAALIDELGGRNNTFADVNESLPFYVREAIGEYASGDLIRTVCGWDESESHGRRACGMTHGAKLLATLLKDIKAPIDDWFEENAKAERDPGGPEPDYDRDHLITILARNAKNIIGRKATATRGGKFCKLVDAVFVACDLSCDGLDSRIDRGLQKLKKPTARPRKIVAGS